MSEVEATQGLADYLNACLDTDLTLGIMTPEVADAYRTIFRLHQPDDYEYCITCAGPETDSEDGEGNIAPTRYSEPWPCDTIAAIARLYSNRSGYRPEWRQLTTRTDEK